MSEPVSQQQQAIAVHSDQADLFASRYTDPAGAAGYRDCFAYSRRRLRGYLDRYLPAAGGGARLLDVGCGTGHHMADLRGRGYEVTGVDGSADMLRHARELNPGADVRQADVEALPVPDASFDYVLCVEVLRYLPDPVPCVREMARVLKPGGVCLATAAPLLSLNAYPLVNRLAGAVRVGNLTRLRQFFTTAGRARRQFRAAGFDPVAVHGVYLGPLNWVERLVPRALPRLLRAWEPFDRRLADRGPLRDLSNMFLVRAVRAGGGG